MDSSAYPSDFQTPSRPYSLYSTPSHTYQGIERTSEDHHEGLFTPMRRDTPSSSNVGTPFAGSTPQCHSSGGSQQPPSQSPQQMRAPLTPLSDNITRPTIANFPTGSGITADDSGVMAATSGPPVVPRVFVSHLAKQFNLNSQYTANLHAFNELGSLGPGSLSVPDLTTRLYMLASMYHLNGVPRSTNNTETPEIKAMLEKVVEHINEGPWEVDSKLSTSIRLLCQEFLYQADQTNYTSLWRDVMAHLQENKEKYKLTDVFGNAMRERKLETVVRRQSSHTRSAMRSDIRTSLSADKFLTLEQFTASTARKYKHVGGSEQLHISYSQRNAIWRCFAFDNPHLMQQKSSQNLGDAASDASDSEHENVDIPQKRKRANLTAGTNFWEALQKYLSKEIALRGTSFENDLWATHLKSIIAFDKTGFRHADNAASVGHASGSPSPLASGGSSGPDNFAMDRNCDE
ncbi:hypothetical protein ARMGADRAFT_1166678, partial [Armillaria gallica]